jgi:tetratricopeptide (TPR) repeat protein
MRWFLALMIPIIMVLAPAEAKQGDERLEPFFRELRISENPMSIRAAEQHIWRIWLESGSDTVDLLMGQALRAMNQNDPDKAIKRLTSIVDMAPDYAEGWNKRATVYYMIGAYDRSVQDIIKTLELEPRHFGALSGLGLIYDAIDNKAGALKAYRRALAVHPHLAHPRARVDVLKKAKKDGNI